ncbi:MAG TPA: F0F1 ATP synthase subunit delta [Dehalococcoidia bacterium]|nr:F0F1 ATP synthase subunit delta [Dehalococcoidia bacterium]
MTASSVSARRYAEAAFELATEAGALDLWAADLRAIAGFTEEPDVAAIFAGGRVPRDQRRRLIDAALAAEVSPLAMNLARLLNERDRLPLARAIQRDFQEMLDARRGVAHATVTTAVPLADDERREIAARLSSLTGKDVDVTPVVDEAIIGGVVARIGDQLIDGSTRTRLLALKRRLEGATR